MRRLLIISLLIFGWELGSAQDYFNVSGYCFRTDTNEIMVGGWGPGFNPSPGWMSWDFSGVYSLTLEAGYNGTSTPYSPIPGTFSPPLRTYSNLSSDLLNECFAFTPVTYTISGRIYRTDTGQGLASVVLQGPDRYFETDPLGYYCITVLSGWSGTVTPRFASAGSFAPATRSYYNVIYNYVQQDYFWTPTLVGIEGTVTHAISGTPLSGVTLYGLIGSPQTDANGHYSGSVASGFSGMITPSYPEMGTFSPPNRVLYNVTATQTGQNFTWQPITYSISGRIYRASDGIGLSGAVVTGFPEEAVTDSTGFYIVNVPRGFSGMAYPGYSYFDSFSPFARVYYNITCNQTIQNYAWTSTLAEDVYPVISGFCISPNPFRQKTVISFALDKPASVNCCIYDVKGRLIQDLSGSAFSAGNQSVQWNGKTRDGVCAAPGLYLCRLSAGSRTFIRKLILVR